MERVELKLEVGKSYVSRGGDVVKIENHIFTEHYSFRGSNDKTFTDNGKWQFDDDSYSDLVREHTAQDHLEKCQADVVAAQAAVDAENDTVVVYVHRRGTDNHLWTGPHAIKNNPFNEYLGKVTIKASELEQ